jgi:hypothetical protein
MGVLNVSGASKCASFSQKPVTTTSSNPYFYKTSDGKYLSLDDNNNLRLIDFSSETNFNRSCNNGGITPGTAYAPKYGDFKIFLEWNSTISITTPESSSARTNAITRYIRSANKTDSTSFLCYLTTAENLATINVRVDTGGYVMNSSTHSGTADTALSRTDITDDGIIVASGSTDFFLIDDSSYTNSGDVKNVLDSSGKPHNINNGMPDYSRIIKYRYVTAFKGSTNTSTATISFKDVIPTGLTSSSLFNSETLAAPSDPNGIGIGTDSAPNKGLLGYKYSITVDSVKYKVVTGTQIDVYARPDPESFNSSSLSTITIQYTEGAKSSTIPGSTSITGFRDINTGAGVTDKTVFNPFTQLDSYIGTPKPSLSDVVNTIVPNRGALYSIRNTGTKTCIISSLGHFVKKYGTEALTTDIGYAYFISPSEYVINTLGSLSGPDLGTTSNPLNGKPMNSIEGIIPGFTSDNSVHGKVAPADTDDITTSLSLINNPKLKAFVSSDIEIPAGQYLVMFVYTTNTKNAPLVRTNYVTSSTSWTTLNNIPLVTFSSDDGGGGLVLTPGPTMKFTDNVTFTADKANITTTFSKLSVEGATRVPMFSFKYKIKTTTVDRTVTSTGAGPVRYLGWESGTGTKFIVRGYYAFANTSSANFNTLPINDSTGASNNAVFLLMTFSGNSILKVNSSGELTRDTTLASAGSTSLISSATTGGGWSFTTDGFLYFARSTNTGGTSQALGTANEYWFLLKAASDNTMTFEKRSTTDTFSDDEKARYATVQCYTCTSGSLCTST